MPVHNADIAAIFEQIAELLEIQGANPFRVRAYHNAARTVSEFGREFTALIAAGQDVPHLPGIGKDLSGKIHEIATTGRCALLDRLRGELPPALTELLVIPGLGPKRVRTLHEALGVDTVAQLRAAAEAGHIRTVPGFGAKTEQRILQHLRAQAAAPETRMLLPVAAQYAEALADWLRGAPQVQQLEIAGSYRRRRETVGDIDILVASDAPAPVMQRFTGYDEVRQILGQGSTRASVLLACGLQVDLRVVEPAAFGAALHYFTGSRAHNIAIRKRAQARGLKINEYGVFRGKARVAGETEESVFAAVDLPWIAPELREDRGEIAWAARAPLPRLIERADLKGDLHCHSRASDGNATLEELAAAARAAGLTYLAITEHSQRLTVAHGLDTARLLQQCEAIDALNARLDGIVLLKGIEVDILEDGRLDLPDEVLGQLDIVIGAVHSHFDLSPARQLKRLMRAMDHPHLHVLAHPGCRELGKRPPIELDWLRLVRHARRRGCFLELNAQPKRLDLTDVHARMAREEGVLVAISSDAHTVDDFNNLDYGIGQARRGWLEAADVLNTRPLDALREVLRRG
jgi:DNA polymerase (family 10)